MKLNKLIMMKNLPFVGISLIFLFSSCSKRSDQETLIENIKVNLISNSLPAKWRAFSDDSPWNKEISSDAIIHSQSEIIMANMINKASNIRFGNSFIPPLWVVNYDAIEHYPVRSTYPFNIWDTNNDFVVDVKIPILDKMWGEQTGDGHIIIIDTTYNEVWEMSRFKGISNDTVRCSTFNIWDLTDSGTGNANEGKRWNQRGGRGSGFPIIAGLIRPEEVVSGEIRHALAFTFDEVKQDDIYFPAVRSDGFVSNMDAPAEGMLFRLDPDLSEADFDDMALSEGAKIVARALQKYGMYLCDSGGDMALQIQLLDKNSDINREKWDKLSPGLYGSIQNIPTSKFHLVETGNPVLGGQESVVTTPLIDPVCGQYNKPKEITILIDEHWPNAVVRYTLDGSEPNVSSILYNGPFLLNQSATIKAKAFDLEGTDSPVMRAKIKIEE